MATRRNFLRSLGVSVAGTWNHVLAGPPRTPPGHLEATVPPDPPDVGSLFPFIESQVVSGEFPLSFLNPAATALDEWKPRARARFHELLHYAPPPCAADPVVLERVECDGYTREHITFQTTPDLRVPAFVLVPKGLSKPAPAIVALHDHGAMYFWGREKIVDLEERHPVLADFKQRYYAGRGIASELARRGYVVIAIDMFYWGERRMILDGDPDDWRQRPASMPRERVSAFNQRASQSEPLVARTIESAGFTWPGVMFLDDIRTVDYLLTRPEVDPARIGCVGLSVGGLRSCHLAALDDRVKAAVVVGWMASYPRQLRRKILHTIGFTKLVPGMSRILDYPDVASMAMPTPLLVINGRRDELFDLEGVETCFSKLAACYAKAGVPDHFQGSLHDAPHEFNARMQDEAWAWLGRWLNHPA